VLLRVNGARLHVERHGDGPEPLLWITGFAISAEVFREVLPRYAERFTSIVYDNRGAGRSSVPARPTSMPELAADAAGVLDRLGIGAAHVYGVSMGGMVAQELALRFPERVRGLILGATSPGGPRAARPTATQIAALVAAVAAARRDGGSIRGRTWLAYWLFSASFRREHPERVRELLRDFAAHRATTRGLLSHLAASTYHDTVARLPQVQAPTLVLHGADDAMAPVANARLLAARIPDAELHLVAGAGHAYALERPEESAALVTDWIDRRSPIAPGRPRTDRAARLEPVTRPFGLAVGAARTGASLVHALRNRGEDHVAADR